jgi:hypothetical protein
VFCANTIDHGGRHGDAMQALARWRHPVTSSEAWGVLHWEMCPTSYRRICMVIKIASDSPAFFVIVIFNRSHNRR